MSKWTKDAIEAPHTKRHISGISQPVATGSVLFDSLTSEQQACALAGIDESGTLRAQSEPVANGDPK